MKFLLIFAAFVAIAVFGPAGVATAQVQKEADIRIDSLELDKTMVTLGCPRGHVGDPKECTDSKTIRVKAAISGKDAKGARLDTFVSGGQTQRVNELEFDWDLTNTTAGTYTLVMATMSAKGDRGKSQTTSVTVKNCNCGEGPAFDACYTVVVSGPSGVTAAGRPVTFTAKVTNAKDGITYNWTVSAGSIASGQGTATIVVDTTAAMGGQSVTATVSIGGPQERYCGRITATESAPLSSEPLARLVSEFRTAGSNCEETFARLDSYHVELNNEPQARGVIILYSDPTEPGASVRRKQQIINHIKMRRFDRGRLTLVDGSLVKDATTQFWLVPAGASTPTPVAGLGPIPINKEMRAAEPYLYAAEYSDGIPGCSGNLYDLKAYASELNTEPKSRGRIIISETSEGRYQSKVAEILAQLRTNSVPQDRLTVVFKKVRANRALETTELWVLPAGKK